MGSPRAFFACSIAFAFFTALAAGCAVGEQIGLGGGGSSSSSSSSSSSTTSSSSSGSTSSSSTSSSSTSTSSTSSSSTSSSSSSSSTSSSSSSSTSSSSGGGTCGLKHLVISEIRSRGPGGAGDDFVELYNPTGAAVTLDSNWKIEGRSNSGTAYNTRWVGSGLSIPAHGHFLVGGSGYVTGPAADEALTSSITDATAVRLTQNGAVIDTVCYATDATTAASFTSDATYGCEGTPITDNPAAGTGSGSMERKLGGAAGSCVDTDDNAADFAVIDPADPQNASSSPTP